MVFLNNFGYLIHSKQFTVLAGIKTKPEIARANVTLLIIDVNLNQSIQYFIFASFILGFSNSLGICWFHEGCLSLFGSIRIFYIGNLVLYLFHDTDYGWYIATATINLLVYNFHRRQIYKVLARHQMILLRSFPKF